MRRGAGARWNALAAVHKAQEVVVAASSEARVRSSVYRRAVAMQNDTLTRNSAGQSLDLLQAWLFASMLLCR